VGESFSGLAVVVFSSSTWSPHRQDAVRQALGHLKELPFRFDDGGSRITYYDER
jgi:hypothetical protein